MRGVDACDIRGICFVIRLGLSSVYKTSSKDKNSRKQNYTLLCNNPEVR